MREKKYIYETKGDITYIYAHFKEIKLITIIDTEDLERILNYKFKWIPYYAKNTDNYYMRAPYIKDKINGRTKYGSIKLHRFIMNAKNEEIVDHKNHNTLDNRKENLRVTINKKNTKHRKSKNTNNTSGYRNVSKLGKWWCVQLIIDGKNTIIKKFPLDKLNEAGVYAELKRNEIYGEFAGNN